MENQVTPAQVVALLAKTDRIVSMEPQSGKLYLQKRYLVALMAFLGWSLLYLMRTNLSISIVDMTSKRSVIIGNETIVQEADFNWSSKEKGVILSAFSWGYTTAPLGALISKRCGGVFSYGIGIVLTGLLTVLTPCFMQSSLYVFLTARFLEGVAEGVSASAFTEALRIWSTPKDRNRLLGFSISGYLVGAMLGYPICGTIAYYMDWKAVFYITGGASIMLSVIWFALIRNSPEEDKMMSLQEKMYMKQFNQCTLKKNMAFPWKQIFASKAVWAYWNERFVAAWSDSFLGYSLPLYIKDIHDVNIQDIGFISSLPHFCAAIALILASFLADFLRNRGLLSPSNVHKSFFGFGQFLAVILLIIVALSEHFLTSIVCFCLFRLFFSIGVVSYQVLPVDMAGHFGSMILGLATSASGIGLSLSPIVMGMCVTHHTSAEWSTYFLILSCLNVWGGIIFFIFGSGELQSWAVPLDDTENAEH